METKWLWISLPYATFGIEINKFKKVVDAAPIGYWMIGKTEPFIKSWVRRKKGVCIELRDLR